MTIEKRERNAIIRAAMDAVSVGGRCYPNRLRPLTTNRAVEVAINAADGMSEADIAAKDNRIIQEAINKRKLTLSDHQTPAAH